LDDESPLQEIEDISLHIRKEKVEQKVTVRSNIDAEK